jgi:YHS domain-containing protein
MQRLFLAIGATLSMSIAVFTVGCGKSNTAGTTQSAKQNETVQNGATSNASDSTTVQGGEDAQITKAMAELSIEDSALAVKQKVCPVSGEALGKMGAPLKMEVKGQTVFLCCAGCKDKLLASPDEYLAKIKK